jgi:AcrR family transcriptional regulator
METQTPLQARAEKKRAQIRTAAKARFLRSGFQGTSTDAIAAEASVSKETLYCSYPRKEDLFVDVVRSLTTERLHLAQWVDRSTELTSTQHCATSGGHVLCRRHLHPTIRQRSGSGAVGGELWPGARASEPRTVSSHGLGSPAGDGAASAIHAGA